MRIAHNLFSQTFRALSGYPGKNPGISRPIVSFPWVSKDIPSFLAPTPSHGAPPPTRRYSDQKSLGLSGPQKAWQSETWQDSAPFSPPRNWAIFSHFSCDFLTKLHRTPGEREDKNPLEKTKKKSSGEISWNCRFLSLVVAGRVLSLGSFFFPCNGQSVGQPRNRKCRQNVGKNVQKKCPKKLPKNTIFGHFLPIWSMLLFSDPVQCSPVSFSSLTMLARFFFFPNKNNKPFFFWRLF